MKALLSAAAVLALAVGFGLAEPAPASPQPVTSSDVQVVSEQVFDESPIAAKGGRGRGGRPATTIHTLTGR